MKLYNEILSNLLDKHAPEKEQTITIHQNAQWFSEEIRDQIRKRCQLERRWKHTRLSIDREIHHTQRNLVNKMCDDAECERIKKILNEATEQKDIHNMTNKILHRVRAPVMPRYDTLSERRGKDSQDTRKYAKRSAYPNSSQTKFKSHQTIVQV